MGLFPGGQIVKEIADAAFKLRRARVSGIIKPKFGFVIIKVGEKNEAGIQKTEIVMNDIRDVASAIGGEVKPGVV